MPQRLAGAGARCACATLLAQQLQQEAHGVSEVWQQAGPSSRRLYLDALLAKQLQQDAWEDGGALLPDEELAQRRQQEGWLEGASGRRRPGTARCPAGAAAPGLPRASRAVHAAALFMLRCSCCCCAAARWGQRGAWCHRRSLVATFWLPWGLPPRPGFSRGRRFSILNYNII
jgi:hypothetical protein